MYIPWAHIPRDELGTHTTDVNRTAHMKVNRLSSHNQLQKQEAAQQE